MPVFDFFATKLEPLHFDWLTILFMYQFLDVNDLGLFCDAFQCEDNSIERLDDDLPDDGVFEVLLCRGVGLLGVQWFIFCC